MSLRPDEPFDVRSVALTYRAGHAVPPHRHGWAQLLYAKSGLMRVRVEERLWLVPPTRALWIPASTDHQFTVRSEVAFRSLYLSPERAEGLRSGLDAIQVSPLLRELILHIMSIGMLDPRIAAHDRIAGMLVDLIGDATRIDLALPMPKSRSVVRLAEHLQDAPHDIRPVSDMAKDMGQSLRSLQRHFVAETGMTIEQWRQKARLIGATAALSAGEDVTAVAFASGYESPSAFSAAFKRQFGLSPRDYARANAL